MNKIFVWISAMRLRTLPLSLSGIFLASLLAYGNGIFDWPIFILAVLTTLSFQILSNLANDYGDGVKGTDNEDRIGPERAIQSGALAPSQLYGAIKINILISIVLASALIFVAFGSTYFLLSILFLTLGVASIIAAMKYTVGDGAYGYKGLGDVFVFMFFGLLSVMGCYVLYAKTLDFVTVFPAITIGLLSTGVLNLNNMRDIVSDKKSNKITLAVKLGPKKAKRYHNALIGAAIAFSLLFGLFNYKTPLNFIFVLAYIPLTIHLKRVNTLNSPRLLDPELKKLALTTVFMALLMGIGYVL